MGIEEAQNANLAQCSFSARVTGKSIADAFNGHIHVKFQISSCAYLTESTLAEPLQNFISRFAF